LVIVQNACQAVGATIDGQPLGAFGVAAYSSNETKNLITREGGMVATTDESVADECRRLRNQADSEVAYVHDAVAYNFRVPQTCWCIGTGGCGLGPELIDDDRVTVASLQRRAVPLDFLHLQRPFVHPRERLSRRLGQARAPKYATSSLATINYREGPGDS
jgi:dTDP-4-amino-4,6-dideoxygalactose transaminase